MSTNEGCASPNVPSCSRNRALSWNPAVIKNLWVVSEIVSSLILHLNAFTVIHSEECSLTSSFLQNSTEGDNVTHILGIIVFLYSFQDFLQSFFFSWIDNKQSFSVDLPDSNKKKKEKKSRYHKYDQSYN